MFRPLTTSAAMALLTATVAESHLCAQYSASASRAVGNSAMGGIVRVDGSLGNELGTLGRYQNFLDLKVQVRTTFVAGPAIEVGMHGFAGPRIGDPRLGLVSPLTAGCFGVVRVNGMTLDSMIRHDPSAPVNVASSKYVEQVLAGAGTTRPVILGTARVTLGTNYAAFGQFSGTGGADDRLGAEPGSARLTGRVVARVLGLSTLISVQGSRSAVLESTLDFGRHEARLDGQEGSSFGLATLSWTFGRSELRELLRLAERLLTPFTIVSETRAAASGSQNFGHLPG